MTVKEAATKVEQRIAAWRRMNRNKSEDAIPFEVRTQEFEEGRIYWVDEKKWNLSPCSTFWNSITELQEAVIAFQKVRAFLREVEHECRTLITRSKRKLALQFVDYVQHPWGTPSKDQEPYVRRWRAKYGAAFRILNEGGFQDSNPQVKFRDVCEEQFASLPS